MKQDKITKAIREYNKKAQEQTRDTDYTRFMLLCNRNIEQTLLRVFDEQPKDSATICDAFTEIARAYNKTNEINNYTVEVDEEMFVSLVFKEDLIYSSTLDALRYYGNLLDLLNEVCISKDSKDKGKLVLQFICHTME